MIFIDRALISGVRFVLDKLAAVADQDVDDVAGLREQLLAAQMQLELGEIEEEAFLEVETRVMLRLRELREEENASAGEMTISGVEVSIDAAVETG